MKPLRGRVAIKPIEPKQLGSILVPDTHYDSERKVDKSLGILAQSSHQGVVLDMGEPARTAKGGAEIPPGFKPGDEVVYVFGRSGTEESRRGVWRGDPCVWISQEEVIAVVREA